MTVATPEQVIGQVWALLERRRTAAARSLLGPALAGSPGHTELLLQSAWVDYLDNKADQSLATVQQVLLSEPAHGGARGLYFELLMDAGSSTEAEPVIIELLRDYPQVASYYGRYASLMLRSLHLKKALQLAHEGLRQDPEDLDCLVAKTIAEFIEAPAADSGALRELVAGYPQHARTLLLIAAALEQRGDYRGARAVAQELVRTQPDNEHIIDMVRALRVKAHWSMLPLWPMMRWGWGASIGLWVLAMVGLRTLEPISYLAFGIFAALMVVYMIYSWVWPPLLRRFMN